MLRILLVDDHPVIRFGVKILIENSGNKVIAETEDGADALLLAQELRPDIILLDIGLPTVDGFQVMEILSKQAQPPKILVLTSQASPDIARRCQRSGASGFIAKKEELEGVTEAISVIGRGYTYFPQFAGVSDCPVKKGLSAPDQKLIDLLSEREKTVLSYLASGMGNKEISLKLNLSEKTISTYKHRLKMKLNARSIIDIIDFSRRNHLID